MKLSRLHIEIIFRKVSARKILENYFYAPGGYYVEPIEKIIRETYLKQGTEDRAYLTEDELLIRGQHLENKAEAFFKSEGLPEIFKYICIPPLFGKNSLVLHGEAIAVQHEQMLRWRQLTHQLGEDLFTCSFLAYRDLLSLNNRSNFAWPGNLPFDDKRMKNLLAQGMSENHSHLLAAGQVFLPAWISMMNKVTYRDKEFEAAGMNNLYLSPEIRFWPRDIPAEIYQQTMWAAMIRYHLVTFLHDKQTGTKTAETKSDNDWAFATLRDVVEKPEYLSFKLTALQEEIDAFKAVYCSRSKMMQVPMLKQLELELEMEQTLPVFDYAITKWINSPENSDNLSSGERWLIYSMYSLLLRGDEEALNLQYLFYTYLLIKSRFRSELIQVNEKVGFYNFTNYQERKRKLLAADQAIADERIRISAKNHEGADNQLFIDARIEINDCDSVQALEDQIKLYDKIIESESRNEQEKKLIHRYCIHFIKVKDHFPGNRESEMIFSQLVPRHASLRVKVKDQAFLIAGLRHQQRKLNNRIYAIDAASSELNARPEVFAQAFRFLKGHYINETTFSSLKIHGNTNPERLMAKYHVGEEFLDMADGLRAIHEAILFLNLERGDSLAHLVCLGLDPDHWYNFKHMRIETRKHAYLDTTVWLMAMIEEHSIDVSRQFFNTLEEKFNSLFDELYRFNNHDSSNESDKKRSHILSSVHWRDFFEAWKLRGDDPFLYEDEQFTAPKNYRFWDRVAVNDFDTCKKARRENPKIALLYSLYNFNPDVKKKGQEPVFEKISIDYINCIKELQVHIQNEISRRGIYVETLPTSNILIGTSKRYDEHPILQFFNPEKESRRSPLHVSINTDDAGVFNTTLENEFMLMALAMSKAKDENGNHKYNPEQIYQWLDRVREMGNEQAPKESD